MRVLRISTILCFLAVALTFCAGQAYTRFFLDETAPVISVDQATVQTSVEDPQSTLLDHVSAYDDHDGDLSGEVMLGGISKLISDNTAKATFYVFDYAGNMAAASCYVQYTDYHKPTFKLGAPLSFRVGSDISLTNKLSAYDVIDGEISDSIRVSATDINISVAGLYSFSVQVTNSLGDTAYLTLPLLITDAPPTRRKSTCRIICSNSPAAVSLTRASMWCGWNPRGSLCPPPRSPWTAPWTPIPRAATMFPTSTPIRWAAPESPCWPSLLRRCKYGSAI